MCARVCRRRLFSPEAEIARGCVLPCLAAFFLSVSCLGLIEIGGRMQNPMGNCQRLTCYHMQHMNFALCSFELVSPVFVLHCRRCRQRRGGLRRVDVPQSDDRHVQACVAHAGDATRGQAQAVAPAQGGRGPTTSVAPDVVWQLAFVGRSTIEQHLEQQQRREQKQLGQT